MIEKHCKNCKQYDDYYKEHTNSVDVDCKLLFDDTFSFPIGVTPCCPKFEEREPTVEERVDALSEEVDILKAHILWCWSLK